MEQKKSLKNLWGLLTLPIIAAFVVGIVFVAVFNTTMNWTNTEGFCISCHEMKDNVYREYQQTVHYSNRSGVRAICSDCHVPHEFVPKMVRKVQASNELLQKMLGTIDTREKFLAKRPQLAQNEWRRMKANDSQECRNCHKMDYFDFTKQGYRAQKQHSESLLTGQKTCIDCHKGIAHELPPIAQGIRMDSEEGVPEAVFHPVVPKAEPASQPAGAGN
ncbi:MAG: NapC/NirT family cytochrome c [Zoogloeaceae bacterium]|jgi:cytochrome c-type protein NapC|nr:NapC/NirT family cytochrome c [Zoogloeaceae bacterium]